MAATDKDKDDEVIDTIYPDVRHPYYIVAPSYARTSAGIRVLHLLCHSLNRRGYAAYILLHPYLPWKRNPTALDLLTPLLTSAIAQSHFERGLAPIMVYPEIVSGNPFGGSCVVRYVMNFPGLLGGDKEYAPDELCFGYSKILAEAAHAPDHVLFLPATDTRIFRPAPEGQKREGSCYYAHKYKATHHGELFEITKNSVEITRDEPDAPTAQEIASLFQRSEVFYTYENTALAIEAVLCGCPAVFLPNPYLSEIIAIKELGPDGYAWGGEPAEIARAKATVEQGARNYLKSYTTYWHDLERFIDLTQRHAAGRAYRHPIRLPNLFDTLRHVYRREHGLWGFTKAVFRKLHQILDDRRRQDVPKPSNAPADFFQIPLLTMGPHGGTRVLVDFANEAARHGAHVRILLTRGRLKKVYACHKNVEIKEIGWFFGDGGGRYLSQWFFLLISPFYMRRGVLVANFFPTVYSVWIARLLFGTSYIYFVQDIETWFKGSSGFLLNMACRLTWHSRRMVTTSPSITAMLDRKGCHPWQQVRIGVSDTFFEQVSDGAPKNYDLVCFPRRESFKRTDRLEKTIAAYRKNFGELRVLCITQDDMLLGECCAWGDTKKPADEASLIAALDSARVLLFTSEREGLGLPPLEAMARGLPCIIFENDGAKTYLEDGQNGFLIAAGDEEEAAQRLHTLLHDPDLYRRISSHAPETAKLFATSQGFSDFLDSLRA